jgi:hypothetical protein
MDAIMNYILEHFNGADVLRLQDPAACKEFIVVGANSLKSLFFEMDVDPSTDPKGKVYFRKASDLTKPSPSRDITCVAIAYFYVRIVQIYVALAFTIIDDPGLMPGRGTRPVLGAVVGGPPVLPGRAAGYYARGGSAMSMSADSLSLRGGAKSVTLTVQQWATTGIMGEVDPANGIYKFRTVTGIVSGEGLFFKRLDTDSGIVFLRQEGTTGRIEDSTVRIFIKLIGEKVASETESAKPSRIRILRAVRKTNSTSTPYDTVTFPQPPEFYLDSNLTKIADDKASYEGYQDLPRVFNKMLQDLADPSIGVNNILKYKSGTKVAKKGLAAPAAVGRGAALAQKVGSTLRNAAGGPPELRVAAQFGILQSDKKPLAHCIARSLQLLDIDSLGSRIPASAKTHICQTTFTGAKTGYKIIVPEYSKSIASSVPGIASLNFLFFVLEKSMKLSSDTEVAYKMALNKLSKAFTGNDFVGTGSLSAKSIDEIKPKPIAPCTAATTERTLRGPGVTVARKGVNELWAYQMGHLKKVDALFNKLFARTDVRGTDRLVINDALLKGGIPAVNKIADEARVILVAYYVECERIYQTTVANLSSTTGAFV